MSKDEYAQCVRHLSQQYSAVGVVFISEAYKYNSDKVKELGIEKVKEQIAIYREKDNEFVLKNNPYCKEIIHIIEEYTDGVHSTSIPIERSDDGKISFGKEETSFDKAENFSGTLTNIIGKPNIGLMLELLKNIKEEK